MATITNRGNGTWLIRVACGYNEKGQQIRINRTIHIDPKCTINSQRKQAEDYAKTLEVDYGHHKIAPSNKIRFRVVAEEYLDSSEQMADSTKAWYRGLLNGRILPALGNKYIQDIVPHDITQFYNSLRNDNAKSGRSKTGKLSGTYRLHYHRALSAIVNYAISVGYISVSPMVGVKVPVRDTQESSFLEDEDITKLLDVLSELPDPMWKAYFTLAIYTSARPGELIGLNWNDLDGNDLHIQAGAAFVKGEGTIRTDRPKTKKSDRYIFVADEAIRVLHEWHKAQLEQRLQFGNCWPEPDAMFTGDEGNRLHISSPTQKWRKIQKQYGLKDVNLYALRHTGASLMYARGVPEKEISEHMGHSRVETTMNIYTHISERQKHHASAALAAGIDEARKKAK